MYDDVTYLLRSQRLHDTRVLLDELDTLSHLVPEVVSKETYYKAKETHFTRVLLDEVDALSHLVPEVVSKETYYKAKETYYKTKETHT